MNTTEIIASYQNMYSDIYKDAYGFRPHSVDTSDWTLEMWEREFDNLQDVISSNEAYEQQEQAAASVRFEKRVATVIESGAGDRATAIRWIHEADDTNGDDDYLCYINGLRYGYFRK